MKQEAKRQSLDFDQQDNDAPDAQAKNSRQDRAARVRRFKQMLFLGFFGIILLPTVLCILLMFRLHSLEQRVAVLYEAYLKKEAERAEITEEKLEPVMADGESAQTQPTAVNKEEAAPEETVPEMPEDPMVTYHIENDGGIRKIYLTFDDGPGIYTDAILDILQEEGIKATFFVIGKEGEDYERLYKRIVDEGHALGMHSYSHKYYELYASEESFMNDMHKLQDYLERITGVRPVLYRFPGGSSNTVSQVPMQKLAGLLEAEGIRYFDWNVSSGDASGKGQSVDSLVYNCTVDITKYNRAMILMHDSMDKRLTVEALPIIIDRLKDLESTAFVAVTDETPAIQHIKLQNENE